MAESIMDIVPSGWRGVIRIGDDCVHCGRPEPIFGAVNKGRPLDTFEPDYFCRGHAWRIA